MICKLEFKEENATVDNGFILTMWYVNTGKLTWVWCEEAVLY